MELNSNFSAEFFKNNRRALRQLFTGTAPIVIAANGLLQRTGDTPFGFQQDRNFWYLTGINEPDVVLVLDKDKEYLIVPEKEHIREVFEGSVEASALTSTSGIKHIYNEKEGWRIFRDRLQKVKHIATIAPPPAYLEHHGFYANPARSVLIEKIKLINGSLELLDLRDHFSHLRMIKQAPELQAIKQAISITSSTIKDIRRRIHTNSYRYEYEVEAALSNGFRKRGASGHAFEPIVASGKNALVVHYIANNAPLSYKDLLLLDVGAEKENYAADISRTYSLHESPTKRQKDIHSAVCEIQDYAVSILKPGILLHDYELLIEQFMGEKLRELGLIKEISHSNVRAFYPYAASHHLGLDAHDLADYKKPLRPGMIITVEPGIHVRKENITVRIEDDILLTAKGAEVLSADLPRSLW